MTKLVQITQEESDHVEMLFQRYNGYLSVLAYLADHHSLDETNKFFDEKWDEAVQLYIRLEQAKAELDNKYHPEGHWTNYAFNFNTHEMEYYNV